MHFAKLFEDTDIQVLVYREYDQDEDLTSLIVVTEIDGIRSKVIGSYSGENQEEKAQAALDAFDFNKAKKIIESFKRLLEESDGESEA
jgi:hypothetical protein